MRRQEPRNGAHSLRSDFGFTDVHGTPKPSGVNVKWIAIEVPRTTRFAELGFWAGAPNMNGSLRPNPSARKGGRSACQVSVIVVFTD